MNLLFLCVVKKEEQRYIMKQWIGRILFVFSLMFVVGETHAALAPLAIEEEAIRDIRRQVAVLSVDIAEKVLRKNLDEKHEQMDMIERMLDEMLSAPKKN